MTTTVATRNRMTRLWLALLLSLVMVVVLVGVRGWMAYASIEREEFAPDDARSMLESMSEEDVALAQAEVDQFEAEAGLSETPAEGVTLPSLAEEVEILDEIKVDSLVEGGVVPNAVSPPLPDDMFTSILLVGADKSGFLADTIIYVLLPDDGSPPILSSLPRDLYLPSLCTDRPDRINAAMAGCRGFATGPELLALTVEDFTGIPVDHFAVANFDGFTNVVDALGGIEICVDHPTRDTFSRLNLPAGCTDADGTTALEWVRSRHTQILIGGSWQSIGATDFSRQENQQDLLFKLVAKMNGYSSLAAFSEVAKSVAESVKLDQGFSWAEGLSIAWNYRGTRPEDALRVSMSFTDLKTDAGAWVLLPDQTFNAALAAVYPPAER